MREAWKTEDRKPLSARALWAQFAIWHHGSYVLCLQKIRPEEGQSPLNLLLVNHP